MNIAICTEDMDSANRILREIIEQQKNDTVKMFTSIFALAIYIFEEAHGDLDAVYLDVRVGNENGVEAAKDFQDYFPFLQVVFIAGRGDCLDDIFWANPTFFLRKPIGSEKIRQSYVRILSNVRHEEKNVITLHSKRMICKLRASDIQYIESQGRKLCIFITDCMYEVNMTMEQIVQMLPKTFYHCHRSYIINLDSVEQLSNGQVILHNKCVVPVARSKYEDLRQKLNAYK